MSIAEDIGQMVRGLEAMASMLADIRDRVEAMERTQTAATAVTGCDHVPSDMHTGAAIYAVKSGSTSVPNAFTVWSEMDKNGTSTGRAVAIRGCIKCKLVYWDVVTT